MKYRGLIALACSAALLAGCNGRRTDNTIASERTAGTTGSGVSRSDRNFVNEQLAGGTAEVDLARLAKERATNPEVKQFATMMIADHTKAGERLTQIATSNNIPREAVANDNEVKARQELSKLTGPDFDRQYMKMMVDDHERAVRELRSRVDENRTLTERLEGKNPANPATVKPESSDDRTTMSINQWAAQTLPTVEAHLNRAKAILADLEAPAAATSGKR